MSDAVYANLNGRVFKAEPATAYKGACGRVHATTSAAIVDLATQELAKEYLKYCGEGAPTFARILSLIHTCPDVFQAAVELVRLQQLNAPP